MDGIISKRKQQSYAKEEHQPLRSLYLSAKQPAGKRALSIFMSTSRKVYLRMVHPHEKCFDRPYQVAVHQRTLTSALLWHCCIGNALWARNLVSAIHTWISGLSEMLAPIRHPLSRLSKSQQGSVAQRPDPTSAGNEGCKDAERIRGNRQALKKERIAVRPPRK